MTPRFKLTIDGVGYDVEVGDTATFPVDVTVDGATYSVDLPAGAGSSSTAPTTPSRPAPARPSAPSPAAPAPSASPSGASGAINAPIPGRIIKVLVNVGDAVTSGQGVIIMESMKMEQTIAAATDGTVTNILVSPGDAMAHGQAMVELG
jgi:biotin carboxyl carrier protein